MQQVSSKENDRVKRAMWFLVGRLPDTELVSHLPIHSTPFSVGRSPRAMLCISHPTVSSVHVEFTEHENGNGLIVRDIGSTNGTYVNGARISTETIQADDLIQIGDVAFRLMRQDANASVTLTSTDDVFDQALALVQFDKLLHSGSAIPHFQPIVDLRSGYRVVGYEVLGRSDIMGLETPNKMFEAASRLNLESELSAMLRWRGVEDSLRFANPPHLFVNTHPAEFHSDMTETLCRLRALSEKQPLTLEIHETVFTSVSAMRELRTVLQALNISLAYDDFGSGQDRLHELAGCPPDYLKFDMSLVRGIDTADASRKQMVGSLVSMVQELGTICIAEGVETMGEAACCAQLGFDLAQGFHFGKPGPVRTYRDS